MRFGGGGRRDADGGLGLTGNTYWRPLPAVIGTMAYYGDELWVRSVRGEESESGSVGEYISSDDDDSRT